MTDIINCPDDNLIANIVGKQSKEKHDILKQYIELTAPARAGYTTGKGGATFIDLFCASGRALIRDTNEWIDGSTLLAYKTAKTIKGENPRPSHFNKIYINDFDKASVDACKLRLNNLGVTPIMFHKTAVEASSILANELNPHSLHFAFLDPYSLEKLDFEIIRNLSKLKRMDILIHLSVMDMNRNFDRLLSGEHEGFEHFAPGWRMHVDNNLPKVEFIPSLLDYWKGLISELGAWVNHDYHLVTGDNKQPLYALMLIAKNKLPHKLWEALERIKVNPSMF